MKNKVLVGVTKDLELVVVNIDTNDNNKSWSYFSITHECRDFSEVRLEEDEIKGIDFEHFWSDKKGSDYYLRWVSAGCYVKEELLKEFSKLFITQEQKELLIKCCELHLKDMSKMTKGDTELINELDKLNDLEENDEELIKLLKSNAVLSKL